MVLKNYLKKYTREERSALASRCGTTLGHLTNVSYGYKSCSAELAAALERETRGAVKRRDMCPSNWRQIWPELAAKTPSTPATQEA